MHMEQVYVDMKNVETTLSFSSFSLSFTTLIIFQKEQRKSFQSECNKLKILTAISQSFSP